MTFSSIDFAIFLPIVFVLYWFVVPRHLKLQNLLLVIASYIFYAWWDWRFLGLIVVSSTVDYVVGVLMGREPCGTRRRWLLLTSIVANLGLLGFFKYFNFFVDSFAQSITILGYCPSVRSLQIVLPVGISFYTFQTLSYSIDVYRGQIKATSDIVAFFAFVSFFPQLVAGPIERATNLLPQFCHERVFQQEQAIDGLRQMLWGLFKKMVIADNCARYVNDVFANHESYAGSTLLLGALLFSFQIYGDFSGYSDAAIGASRLFGFNLMRNFAYPYFSRDIAEFWRRWHISLSTWFRDYVYVPLGGSQGGTCRTIRNVFLVFLISGLWHGANWTFVLWGLINAILFLPLILLGINRTHLDTVAKGAFFPPFRDLCQIIATFFVTTLAWIVFRAESVSHAIRYICGIFDSSLFSVPEVFPKKLIMAILLFVSWEWLQRERHHALDFRHMRLPVGVRWGFYYALVVLVLAFGGPRESFIYFQF